MKFVSSLARKMSVTAGVILLVGTVSLFAIPSASAASGFYELQNVANSECLNGSTTSSHAELILTPCSWSDNHMTWTINYDPSGGLLVEYQDQANGLCLNGSVGSGHAELILTTCGWTDNHMSWYTIPGSEFIEDDSNGLCLNGSLVTSHAELILTSCNSSDNHMDWLRQWPGRARTRRCGRLGRLS
jgi:hypothetical protein